MSRDSTHVLFQFLRRIGLSTCWVLCAITPLFAHAQGGLIERQFQRPPEPRSQPGQFWQPSTVQTVPDQAEKIVFMLNEIVVDGVTVYADPVIRSYFERHIGREVSLADIYTVAHALTARYRNDGYILSQVIVPAQAVDGGRVRLQAVEGYVSQVELMPDGPHLSELVKQYASRIENERPLTAATLERYLLLLNDLPGMVARATLVASKRQEGASDLIIEVLQQHVSGGLGFDNRGSDLLGPMRVSADLSLNPVFGAHDRMGLKLVSTLNGELDYASLWHEIQIGDEGGKLSLQVNAVRSKPAEGASFIPLDLETESDSGSIGYSTPLIRSRRQNLYLRASLSSYDGSTDLLGFANSKDRIRAVRLGLTYDLADQFRGINIVDFEIAQGLRGLGASEPDDPALSRADGRPDFTKLNLYVARLQSLAPRWTFLTALNAQYAFSDLLAPELFSFGGEQFGRGYDPSELVGDHGAAVKLEVRYTQALDNGVAYTGYGFYDLGYVRQITPAGFAPSASAASAGVGVRFDLTRVISGFVELAKPLTRDVAVEGDRNPRGYFGLAARF